MKKTLSIFLAVLMLVGCMAISFSASAALTVDSVDVSGYYPPRVGSKPDLSHLKVSEGFTIKEAKIEIHRNSRYEDATNETMTSSGEYRLSIRVEQLPTLTYASDIANRATLDGIPYKDWNGCTFGVVSQAANGLKTYLYLYHFKAEPASISRFDFTFTEPKAGDSSNSVAITTNLVAFQQDLEIYSWYEDGKEMTAPFTFKAGKKYRAEFTVVPVTNTDYHAFMGVSVFTVNGKVIEDMNYDTWKNADVGNFYEADRFHFCYVFELPQGQTPSQPDPQPQGDVCAWCGKTHEGFFQKIIGFFHNILAAIFGAKY